jgi:carbon monoxide dehydrogenase subunit G
LRNRIDEIVAQAQQEGLLSIAIHGLNSIRQTLDSVARLAGHDRAGGTEINVAVRTNVHLDLRRIADRLIDRFDHEPEVKARIAQALTEIDDEQSP